MKAITIHQPFAQYVADGIKKYETRSWSTNYRGLVAIHAGKKWDKSLKEDATRLSTRYADLPDIGESPVLGAILAIALLEDVVSSKVLRDKIDMTERAVGGYADGRYGWEMRVIERFDTPIPASGQQGLWTWDWDGVDKNKRIAVVGSRDYADLGLVKDYIYSLLPDTVIISGGAQGVDLAAETHARERGMKVISIPVSVKGLSQRYEDRKKEYGVRAMARNQHIIEMAGSVVAFWNLSSSGTKNSIERAKKLGREIVINPIQKSVQVELVQKKLTDFGNTYNEVAYIEQSNVKAESSPDIDDNFEWVKPWLINDYWVWSSCKVDGVRCYKPVRIDSDEAKKMSRNLSGYFYNSETIQLRDWLEDQCGWQDVPYEIADVGDMASGYFLRQGALVESIPLKNIVFTQDQYKVSIAMAYYRSLKIIDEDGQLPYVARFGVSDKIYVFDGTHRTLAHMWAGRETIRCDVNTFAESFEDACGYFEDDSEIIEIAEQVIAEALEVLQGVKVYG